MNAIRVTLVIYKPRNLKCHAGLIDNDEKRSFYKTYLVKSRVQKSIPSLRPESQKSISYF